MTGQELEMAGKVCIVTGATSGLGKETALGLVRKNAIVVLVGRSLEKCTRTANEIKDQTGNRSVDFLVADLSSQKDIQRIVQEFKNRYQRLDVLVNNAGAVFLSRLQSVDGIEMTFALNHLSYFLLTTLLLDLLAASAPARIINVTSEINKQARLSFDDIESRKSYNGISAYAQSKLANLLFTYELAHRLEGTGVTVNALHPGYIASDLGKNNAGFLKPFLSLFRFGGISPEEAARPLIHLASDPELAGITGSYFIKDRLTPSLLSYEQAVARLLWEVSDAMILPTVS